MIVSNSAAVISDVAFGGGGGRNSSAAERIQVDQFATSFPEPNSGDTTCSAHPLILATRASIATAGPSFTA
jgi:hypothetical protein